jgi:hypothetical protein
VSKLAAGTSITEEQTNLAGIGAIASEFNGGDVSQGFAFLAGLINGKPFPMISDFTALNTFLDNEMAGNTALYNGLNALMRAGRAFLSAVPDDASLKTTTAALIAQSHGAL